MARPARHELSAERPSTNSLYHVTNRGVGRRSIFVTELDRLVFLAILAAACIDDGMRVQAFCLMSNHFHLLVEDPRGMLSRVMLRVQTAYARYFNDSHGRRGSGHVFGDRFFSERVDSARYYEELACYILLNPLRCITPLATDAASYPWSSAPLTLSDVAPDEFFSKVLDGFGGVDALLAAMPRPSRAVYERTRRERFEALRSGAWIEHVTARCGRTVEDMRQVLAARAGMTRPTPAPLPVSPKHSSANAASLEDLIARRFSGRAIGDSLIAIRDACSSCGPWTTRAAADLLRYSLWRFTSGSLAQIAIETGELAPEVLSSIERVRGRRRTERSWHQLLSRLEWTLTLALRSAPWRV